MCRLRARHGAVGGRSACAGASVALHRVGGMEGTGWILQLLPGSSTLLHPSRTSRQRGLLLAQGRSPCSVRSAPNPRHTHSRGAGGLSPVASLPGRGIVPSCRCCLGWGTRVSAAPGFALNAPAQPYHPRWPPPRCRISHLSAWQLPLPAPTCWQGALGRQGCRQGFRQRPCCWQNPGHTVHPGHPRGPGSFWAFLYRRVCCVCPAHLGFSVFTLPLSPTDPPGSKGCAHRMPCDPVPFQAGSVTGMSPQTPPMRGHAGTRTCRPGTAQPCSWLQGLLQVPLTP